MSDTVSPKAVVQSLVGLLSPEARTELLNCLVVEAVPPSPLLVRAGVRAHYISPTSLGGGMELVVKIQLADETYVKAFQELNGLSSNQRLVDRLAPLWDQAVEWLAKLLLAHPVCKMEELS